jgi:hypothetical protein
MTVRGKTEAICQRREFPNLKDLETRNLIIPVVGDFGGNKPIRAVGQYLKTADAPVAAFYVSNVEQFLQQGSSWETSAAAFVRFRLTKAASSSVRAAAVPTPRTRRGIACKFSTARMLPELMCAEPAVK